MRKCYKYKKSAYLLFREKSFEGGSAVLPLHEHYPGIFVKKIAINTKKRKM